VGVGQVFRSQMSSYYGMIIKTGDLVSIVVLPHKPKIGIVIRTRNIDDDKQKSYALVHTFTNDKPRFVTMDCLKLISSANM